MPLYMLYEILVLHLCLMVIGFTMVGSVLESAILFFGLFPDKCLSLIFERVLFSVTREKFNFRNSSELENKFAVQRER
jgi:hypothetical protein